MRRIKITVAYDGTDFVGWQRQNNGPSIQGELEKAVAQMVVEHTHVQGAGRTDAGVHALGQVANFDTKTDIPLRGFLLGMNSILPRTIAVVGIEEVDRAFNARFSAKQKLYRYRIRTGPVRSPVDDRFEWHFARALDADRMREAARHLVGEQNFAAFRAADCDRKTTVRTVSSLAIHSTDNTVTVEVEGPGFLKNMVRIITGTLVAVGVGKLTPDDVRTIRDAGDRTRAGMTAPAQGLTLVRVDY